MFPGACSERPRSCPVLCRAIEITARATLFATPVLRSVRRLAYADPGPASASSLNRPRTNCHSDGGGAERSARSAAAGIQTRRRGRACEHVGRAELRDKVRDRSRHSQRTPPLSALPRDRRGGNGQFWPEHNPPIRVYYVYWSRAMFSRDCPQRDPCRSREGCCGRMLLQPAAATPGQSYQGSSHVVSSSIGCCNALRQPDCAACAANAASAAASAWTFAVTTAPSPCRCAIQLGSL